MSLMLNPQMKTLFSHGLNIIRTHEKQILTEWECVLTHLREAGKNPEKSVDGTIHLFTEYLFEVETNDTTGELIHTRDDTAGFRSLSIQTNQFIITLLENAVHKAIQTQVKQNYHDHQAVQYVFSTISEHILTQPYQKHFSIDTFLKHLVSSQQLPIEWVAILIKNEETFSVEKWFNSMSQDLLLGNDSLKANSIYSLSELLLMQMPQEERNNRIVLPIPYNDGIFLICTYQHNAAHVIPFVTYALQVFEKGKDALKLTKHEQQWKDAVIMFNELIMRSETYDEAVENITAGFVNYLPFERCALFSYSTNEQVGVGLFGHRLDNKAIQNITEDISNLPIIKNSLQTLHLFGKGMNFLQPVYAKDASVGFPDQYIQQFQLKSVVIAPIFTKSDNKLLGAAILDQGPGNFFKVSQTTFAALIKFGQSAGEILSKYQKSNLANLGSKKIHLSNREIDVLKLMAEGASTNEAASSLHLSEYTVRDYVSAIMQKMDARNRTEAVARAIRDGLI